MFGRGMGRGMGRGGGQGRMGGVGAGSGGYCICINCGNKIPHERGVPCNQQVCPACGSPMTRDLGGINVSGTSDIRKSDINMVSANKSEKYTKAYIKPELCKGCRVCMPACKYDAMKFDGEKVVILEHKCTGCFDCIAACPFGAIIKV